MSTATRSLILARRFVATPIASRLFRPALVVPATNTTTSIKFWFTSKALNDTHMHDEFQVLEDMLEKNWHDVSEEEMKHLRDLATMKHAPMAVDGPDGDSDGHMAEELAEVKAIIDDVAAHKEEIKARLQKVAARVAENKKTFAVDSPDGETDGHIQEEMEEIKHIIEDAAAHEDKQKVLYQHKMEAAVRKDRAKDPEHDW